MKRRAYLAGLGIGALGGCFDEGTRSGSTRTDQYLLAIESVRTHTFSLRLNDLGDDVGAPSPSLEDLDDDVQEVVRAALDGEYETDEPEAWLRTFLDETPYVEVDGSFYSLEHSLPEHLVTAEPVDPDGVDGEIASPEAYEEAVTLDGVVFTGFVRIARNEGYRTVDFHPQLRAFVEEYEAVEYRGETLRMEYDVADSGPPYRVSVERATDTDVYDGPVIDVEEMDAEHREPVREAAATSGLHGVDDPPDGLPAVVEEHRYVSVEGTYYAAYADDSSDVDAEFDATLVDDGAGQDSPARLSLQVENTGEERLTVSSGAPGPFGVQYVHPRADPDSRVLLWTDEYEESNHVGTSGRSVTGVNDIGITTEVAPGDTASRTFEMSATDLTTGTYELDDSVGLAVGENPGGGSRPYTVVLSVERGDR